MNVKELITQTSGNRSEHKHSETERLSTLNEWKIIKTQKTLS